MSSEIQSKDELIDFLRNILDSNYWEVCEPPTPDEVLNFIYEKTGLLGLPGDDGGYTEVTCEDLEPLTTEEIKGIRLEAHEREAYEKLENILNDALPSAAVTPFRFEQGIHSMGSLIRVCFRIDVECDEKTLSCLVRDATYCDTLVERFSGPMWEGF